MKKDLEAISIQHFNLFTAMYCPYDNPHTYTNDIGRGVNIEYYTWWLRPQNIWRELSPSELTRAENVRRWKTPTSTWWVRNLKATITASFIIGINPFCLSKDFLSTLSYLWQKIFTIIILAMNMIKHYFIIWWASQKSQLYAKEKLQGQNI